MQNDGSARDSLTHALSSAIDRAAAAVERLEPSQPLVREIEILKTALNDSVAERASLKSSLVRSAEHDAQMLAESLAAEARHTFARDRLEELERRELRNVDRIESLTRERDASLLRVATLERVRERLHSASDRLVRERDEAREQAAIRQGEIEQHSSRAQELTSRYAVLQERLRAAEDRLARAESTVRELSGERDLVSERALRFQEDALELERQMTAALHALSRNAALVRSLETAQERALETIATLEDMRSRLEFEVASRVTQSEAKALDALLAMQQLASERASLAETLSLRERQIANLEDALRHVTLDFVRTTELELQRYRAALASVEASPIGRLRALLRGFLRRPSAISKAARRTTVLAKRRRHLRSA